jgi:GTPase KRas protein
MIIDGCEGKDISKLSFFKEKEVIFLPNTHFVVKEILSNDIKSLMNFPIDMDIITFEQIPTPDADIICFDVQNSFLFVNYPKGSGHLTSEIKPWTPIEYSLIRTIPLTTNNKSREIKRTNSSETIPKRKNNLFSKLLSKMKNKEEHVHPHEPRKTKYPSGLINGTSHIENFSVTIDTTTKPTNTPIEIKIALCGGGGIGAKSCAVIQFIQQQFASEYDPTVEDSFKKHLCIQGHNFLVDILDTAGQEDFSAVRDQYMRTNDGFLLGYDITSQSSFDEVAQFYDQILRVKDEDWVPMVLVGNKIDLEKDRKVTTEQGKQKATDWQIPFFEMSCLTRINVDEAFCTLIWLTYQYKIRK